MIALRTQQVIAEESGVASVVDPLGGSYYVEWLTDSIEAAAEAELSRIDDLGGATAAIEKGYYQKAIARSAYREQRAVEEGRRVIVGVNKYAADEPGRMKILRVDPAILKEKVESLRRLRESRDEGALERALKSLAGAARESEPTMPVLLECARARATLGEMSRAVGGAFGRYRPAGSLW